MCSWQVDRFLDDSAEAAAQAPSTVGKLFSSPAGQPSEAQRQTLDACVHVARRAGLIVPSTCHVVWKDSPDDCCPAGVRLDDAGVFTLAFNVNRADLRGFAASVLHELAHVSDLNSGWPYSHAELEVRACRFSRAAVEQVL